MSRIRIAGALILALATAACATQPTLVSHNPPGFFLGLVHGFFAIFSLIGSLIWPIRVYAFPNSGLGYDLGFVIGFAAFIAGARARANLRLRINHRSKPPT
jgi:hypothetical protein